MKTSISKHCILSLRLRIGACHLMKCHMQGVWGKLQKYLMLRCLFICQISKFFFWLTMIILNCCSVLKYNYLFKQFEQTASKHISIAFRHDSILLFQKQAPVEQFRMFQERCRHKRNSVFTIHGFIKYIRVA